MNDQNNNFSVILSSERILKSVNGESVSQLDLCLQVWQDLVKMNPEYEEDILIKDVLEQILTEKFGSKEDIPFPECYKEKKTEVVGKNE